MSSILIVILTNWLGRAAVYTRCAFLRKNLQYLRFMTCYVFMLRALQIENNCFQFIFKHQVSSRLTVAWSTSAYQCDRSSATTQASQKSSV